MSHESHRQLVCGGYEAVFRPDLDRKYMCPVCLGAMRDAMQTPCGHRFCKICIEEVANGYEDDQMKCPVDNHWFSYSEELFADNAVRREILSLGVCCNNSNDGCCWTGELRDLELHLECCDFAVIQCENGCSDMIFRRALAEHLATCANRPSTCVHCGKSVVYMDLPRHEVLECAMFPVRCTLCGQGGIKRHDIHRHLNKDTGDCPQGVVFCPYKKYGCQYQDRRRNIASHSKESADIHLGYVEATVNTQAQEITKLNKKVLEISGMFEDKLSQYETMVREVTSAQTTNYTGKLQWKVSLVPGRERYTSQSFYTGSPGYKLHLSLELGYMDQGTSYASLYIVLEKGQFDDDLFFPFNAVCDISLISQASGSSSYRQTVESRCVPRCRQDGDTLNTQRGRLRFIPVEEICSSKYCKDDAIFLQVLVKDGPNETRFVGQSVDEIQ